MFPVEHGMIEDRMPMEKIWHYTFYTDLRIDPSEHPVLLTEAPLNPQPTGRKWRRICLKPLMYQHIRRYASSIIPLCFW